MLNSQSHHQSKDPHYNNFHQNQLQQHQHQHQQDFINNFQKDFSASTDSSSNLHRNFSLSTISSTPSTTSTALCSDSNVNFRHYKVTDPSPSHVNNTSSAFFSFSDLTTALQQDHLISSSSTSTLIEASNSSSPTSSTIFGSGHGPGSASIVSNNSNNNSNNCPSPSSVISSNRISSSASPPISSHSSNGTLNLGSNNSIGGSPNRINEHYNHQNHHLHHHHHSFHRHNTASLHSNMSHHQHTQNNTTSSTLGNNPFSLVSESGVGGGVSSGTGGGMSDVAHSNFHHQMQLHQHHQQHQHQHHQQQQQQQQQQQHFQQHQASSQSSKLQHQSHSLQRSMSSNSSSMTSPTSVTSHHIHHHQIQMQSSSSPTTNKSCWCIGGDATYHFKTLVPAVASGAIIGKGGETIAALQRDTGARVKMSKSHDFYPGTQERVCLITGSVEAIMTVLDFIMDKIREKPDLTTKLTDIESKQAQERDKQVKILVPNSTAGMIIGKAGAYIKQIKEESGSYVQISQKPKDITLQERCITIIGEKDNNKIACKMILAKIVEDPQSGTCLNVSYADVNGPVANYNPTGSPYATNQNAISSSTASLNSALGSTVTGAGLLLNGTGINLSVNLGAPNPSPNPTIATQVLDHIKVAMRGSGYSEAVTTEVCAALGVLAKYGVLGVGVGLPHTNGAHSAPVSYLGVSALEQSAAAATAAATGSVFGALGQVSLDQYITGQSTATPRQTAIEAAAAAQFDPFRHTTSQAATPISINNNSFGLAAAAAATTGGATAQALGAQTLGALSKSPTPGDLGAKDSKNLEIPEPIVGAILGPSGRSLVEIQHVSGANIQISKKGIFAPGTRNRIVTITGQPNAIAMAHYLIEQKITEEEAKRARQNTVATAVIQ